MPSHSKVHVPVLDNFTKSYSALSLVHAADIFAIILIILAVAFRPNATPNAPVNAFGQTVYYMVYSTVPSLLAVFAPFALLIVGDRYVKPGYFLLTALVFFLFAWILQVGITKSVTTTKIDLVGNTVAVPSPATLNGPSYTKLTAIRESVGNLLYGSSFSCLAVAILQYVMESGIHV